MRWVGRYDKELPPLFGQCNCCSGCTCRLPCSSLASKEQIWLRCILEKCERPSDHDTSICRYCAYCLRRSLAPSSPKVESGGGSIQQSIASACTSRVGNTRMQA